MFLLSSIIVKGMFPIVDLFRIKHSIFVFHIPEVNMRKSKLLTFSCWGFDSIAALAILLLSIALVTISSRLNLSLFPTIQ